MQVGGLSTVLHRLEINQPNKVFLCQQWFVYFDCFFPFFREQIILENKCLQPKMFGMKHNQVSNYLLFLYFTFSHEVMFLEMILLSLNILFSIILTSAFRPSFRSNVKFTKFHSGDLNELQIRVDKK